MQLVVKKDNDSVFTKRKMHHIMMDSGTMLYFSDHENAMKYLTRFNNYMTTSSFELNNIFAKLMYIYRANWLYQPDVNDEKVVSVMNQLINEFSRMFKIRYRGTSAGILIMPSFKNLNFLLIDYCNIILKYSLRASDSPIFREIAMFKNQIEDIYKKFSEILDPGELGEMKIRQEYYPKTADEIRKTNLNGETKVPSGRRKTIRLNGGKKVAFEPPKTTNKKGQPALPVGVR